MTNDPVADPYDALVSQSDLIDQAILIVRKALRRSPTPEQRRRLDQRLLDLAKQSALVEGKLDQYFTKPVVIGPTQAQVNAIADLTREVEQMKNTAVAQSEALALTGRVLDLASAVTA